MRRGRGFVAGHSDRFLVRESRGGRTLSPKILAQGSVVARVGFFRVAGTRRGSNLGAAPCDRSQRSASGSALRGSTTTSDGSQRPRQWIPHLWTDACPSQGCVRRGPASPSDETLREPLTHPPVICYDNHRTGPGHLWRRHPRRRRPPSAPSPRPPGRHRRSRAGRPGRRGLLRRRRAPPPRLRHQRPRGAARRHCRPHRAPPARHRRHRPQLRRPDPGLPALQHAQRRLQWPRRGDPGPRLVHRSFPLFGYSLDDYNVLFEEKLAIFAALRDADRTGQPVRWKGTIRPPLDGVRVYPPVEHPPLSTWVVSAAAPSRSSAPRATAFR